ncbi:MIT domain-containing protein 1 [Culicoides brevitarsis]|uniref:MIT domain-containing protein 1 n=1 Tax=Culicoides brevitarsis TaxID=469753 RepID=UPI00307C88B4
MSAVSLLTKAIELDVSGRRIEALKLYEEGIGELLRVCKAETNEEKKKHFQSKIVEYMNRAEEVKKLVQKWNTKGEICDKIHVIDGASGFSYRRVFEKYMKDDVKEILIDEPYLKEHFQICNLVMFCELALSKCKNLRYIKVTTIKDVRPSSEQNNGFSSLTESLAKKSVTINFDFHENLHDRQVILSNGYIIKIGRGLHYFKPPANKYSIGAFDHNFRECRETNIDIFYCPENKK